MTTTTLLDQAVTLLETKAILDGIEPETRFDETPDGYRIARVVGFYSGSLVRVLEADYSLTITVHGDGGACLASFHLTSPSQGTLSRVLKLATEI